MDLRQFGNSDIFVSPIGYGAGFIGSDELSNNEVNTLLNAILDSGINFIDTARGYGNSEERIGASIGHRRSEFILSTKVGYGIEGQQDWTYDCIIAGVDAALLKLKTDYIDIVHLHSCPKYTLEQTDIIAALDRCIEAGKVRLAAYSGENDDLDYALHSGRFASLMTSINVFDQRFIDRSLWEAKQKGLGVIAKRPIGNAAWRFQEQPTGDYCEEYWHRFKAMAFEPEMPWIEFAVRFTAFIYGVDTCIIGSTNIKNIKNNILAVENGKLPDELVERARSSFRQHDNNWIGQL